MALDAKKFVLGDWPGIELVKRGFQQDYTDADSYSKRIGAYTLHVASRFDICTGLMDGSSLVLVKQKLGESIGYPWHGVVKNELVPKAVDYLTEVLEGYSSNPQFKTLLNNTLKEIQQESVDPKNFIMSNDWAIDELKSMGFRELGNNQYWVKRLKNNRADSVGAIVVWFGAGKTTAHVALEILLRSWLRRDPEYTKVWDKNVSTVYAGQLAQVLEQVFLAVKDDRQLEWDAFSMELGPALQKKFGRNFNSVINPDTQVIEGLDAKDFIMSRAGFFPAFRARMEELGWYYDGVKKIPSGNGSVVFMVDEHWFSMTHEPFHFSADQGPVSYTLNVAEHTRGGAQRLEAYADCVKSGVEVDDDGRARPAEEEWQTETHIQPDNMSGENFADLVDEEVRASVGPED